MHGLVIPSFLIWRQNILFSRYLDFCAFVKSTDFKIRDIIIGIASSGISTSAYFFWILSTLKKKFYQILVCCKGNISNMFLPKTGDWKISIKILEANFGNSILNKSKWNKINEGIAKSPYLELRGKKIIINQKIRPPWYLAQISIWMIGLGILDIETIKLSKSKMDSKVIKSLQCSLKKSHAVYQLNLILNYNQELALFR